METWRPIEGWRYYEVSNLGRVRSTALSNEPRIRKPYPNHRNRYLQLMLKQDGAKQLFTIHGLVARAFIGPCPDGYEVAHINGDRSDCRAVNLVHKTKADNEADKIIHGTIATGFKLPHTRLSVEQIQEIRSRFAAGGILQKDLAAEYGIGKQHMSAIINRKKRQ